MKTIAYIISQFPETHETFILREVRELMRQGVPIRIFSLKKCRDKIIHPLAMPLLSQVVYPSFRIVLASIVACLLMAVLHPYRFWKTLGQMILDNYKNRSYCGKSLAIFPMACYIAWRIRREKIVWVHAHWATIPTTVAWVVWRLTDVPYSFTAHAWDIYLHPGNLLRLINEAQMVATCTRYNKLLLEEQFLGRLVTSIQLCYHGLDLDDFPRQTESRSRDEFSILAVGRLVEQKGFTHLIKACKVLQQHGLKFRCYIAGQGPQYGELRSLINKLQLDSVVELTGILPQSQLFELMRTCHVFVAPSVIAANHDRDGIPNVILEAMAWQMPVVATKTSGIPEAVIDHHNGILVNPADPEALATAIEELHANPQMRQLLGENGRHLVEKQFNIQENVNTLKQIFQKAIKPKIRVVHIIETLERRGAEKQLVNLIMHLDRSRFEPFVCYFNGDNEFSAELQSAEIPCIQIPKKRRVDFRLLWRLYSWLHQNRIDIVHTHVFTANLWGRLAAFLARVPVIIAHEHGSFSLASGWRKTMNHLLSLFTDSVLVVSENLKQQFSQEGKLPTTKVKVFPNSLDFAALEYASRNGYLNFNQNRHPIIGTVGALEQRKDHFTFLQMARRVLQQFPQAEFWLIGDGPLRHSLEQAANQLGISSRIIFWGNRADAPALMKKLDIFVLTSQTEGVSLALLEAMGLEIPVLVTEVGGHPDLLQHGKLGWLAPPQNPTKLAEQIFRIMENHALRSKKIYHARRYVSNSFEIKKNILILQRHYEQILQRS